MTDLEKDLVWLETSQKQNDLSDNYLKENGFKITRDLYQNTAPELAYGITFVESSIARKWLERAIKAETELTNLKEKNVK